MEFSHHSYLLINICSVAVPLIASFHPRIKFNVHFKEAFLAMALTMVLFIPWDIFFTEQGIWGFNEEYLIGFSIFNLPLEEWLFFICIPFACTFTFFCFQNLTNMRIHRKTAIIIGIAVVIVGWFVAVSNISSWYTSWTGILLGIFMIVFLLKSKDYFPVFFPGFVILLIPFSIVNGMLTGLEFWNYPIINWNPENVTDQIVWYNNSHNLSIRFFSIPIEDAFYAMLMLGMNIFFFEKLVNRKKRIEP